MRWPIFCLLWPVLCYPAADLSSSPEHLRPDPFGGIVRPDGGTAGGLTRDVRLEAPRGGYVSTHLVVRLSEPGEYQLAVEPFPAASGIQIDLFREWFHFVPSLKAYFPDALIPVSASYRSRMPDPDNQIPDQTAQSFWVDFWVPANAKPGVYQTRASLIAGAENVSLNLRLNVLSSVVPSDDVVAIDHNSYGTSWLPGHYSALQKRVGANFLDSDEYYGLIHSLHRIFYEHRGVFHQLGYGHAGKVGPEFAPKLEGSGRHRRIADWTNYDRHYGPLLDGSAFASTRRGPRPIPFVYLPINPEWPASTLWWGEPGYEAEFVNVASAMERHFREKGWTKTRFELFFNHKKRYKGFSWDGDETRFTEDLPFFGEYKRLLNRAVPKDSPVKFVFRTDASWMMERQFKELAGIIDFWVCGGGMFSWFDYAPKLLKERGDIVWTYGGTPALNEPSSHITLDVLRPWIFGIDGFVRWLTTSPGPDPWFKSQGEREALIYPGTRFGIDEPIASIRLKIQRNAIQDLTLLDSFRRARPLEILKAEAARRYNDTTVKEWWTPRPPAADRPPDELSNADIDDAMPKNPKFAAALDSAAWQRVREYVMQLAREVR